MRRIGSALLCLSLWGCGDQLVDGRYQGRALFTLSGEVGVERGEMIEAQYLCEDALERCLPEAPDLCDSRCQDLGGYLFDQCLMECQPGLDCPQLCDEQLWERQASGELECEGEEDCDQLYMLAFEECLFACDEGACFSHCEASFQEPLICEGQGRSPDEGLGCGDCVDEFERCLTRENIPPWARRPERLKVGLFWIGRGGGAAAERIEQAVNAAARFPATYELKLHSPPPEAAVRGFEGLEGQGALGLILVYLDEDGDGRWTPAADQLVGGTGEIAVLFVPEALRGEEGAWPAGYHLVWTTVACDELGRSRFYFTPTDQAANVQLSADRGTLDWLTFRVDCDDMAPLCPPLEELEMLCQEPEFDPWLCGYCGQREMP